MNYNPQDPMNFGFYQTYLDDDKGTRSSTPGPRWLAAVIVIVILGVILGALGR